MPPPVSRQDASSAQALTAVRDVIRLEVQALPTPLEQAELTTQLLREVAQVQSHIAALRMDAVAALRQQGWTYRAIAAALGVSTNAIAQIERQRLRRSGRDDT